MLSTTKAACEERLDQLTHSSNGRLVGKSRGMMQLRTFVLLVAFCVVFAEAVNAADLRRALGEIVASSEHHGGVSAQDLLEGPPELTTSLPLFNKLVREDRRDLLHQIGELHLFGDGSVPHNASHAKLFLEASASYGSAQAQFLLGTQRASADDDAAAHLYYEFAAHGRSIGASMALGYRALHGYSSAKSCLTAMRHYKFAAERVVTEQSSHKFQLYAFPEPARLSETEGARYHSDLNAAEDFHRAEYLRQRAGDLRSTDVMVQSASITLFSDLYEATGASDLEEHSAREREAVRFLERSIELGSIKAQALLGHVYAYGLAGCEPNVTRAVELYEAALSASQGRPSGEAANGLGVVYSRGMGDVPADPDRARNLFKVAANAGHAEGVYNSGMAFVELGAHLTSRAKEYFVAGAQVGHLKSTFQLARLKQRQIDSYIYSIGGATASPASCHEVVELYKSVAERSREGAELMTQALTHAQRGNWALALELYLIAAEMGYEVAQSNALWLIARVQRQVFGASSSRDSKQLEHLYARLVARAVDQDSVDALLGMGDAAYDDEDFTDALRHYQHADLVSAGSSARALYSVGYMYENGLGVSSISPERATLYYHLAGEKEPSLRLVMALLKLKLSVQTSFAQLIETASRAWRAVWQQEAGSPLEDVTSSKMTQGMDDGSVPTSRDVENHGAFQQQIKTLADSAALADTNEYDTSPGLEVEATTRTTPYEYAAALQFRGDKSRLLVEFARGELPREQQDFTIETWLRIDELPTAAQVVTLVDAIDNFQLELLPVSSPQGASSWMLRFRKYSLVDEQLPELVLAFQKAPLAPNAWRHVALTFDAAYQTVTLVLDGRVKQVLSFRPHPAATSRSEEANVDESSSPSSQFFAVGSSVGRLYGMGAPNSRAFAGQLVHFRFWKTRKSAKEVAVLMMEQYDDVATRDLLVHLRYKLHGSKPAAERVMNGDQTVPDALGVQLKIAEFPPAN
jgi:TPR repeat protein